MLATIQQTAVHFGVQRLHTATEHFGPTGEVGNILHCDARFAKQLGRPTRRENLYAQRCEPSRKLHDPRLVKYADERALHSHVMPPQTKAQQCKRIGKIEKAETNPVRGMLRS